MEIDKAKMTRLFLLIFQKFYIVEYCNILRLDCRLETEIFIAIKYSKFTQN